MNRPFATALACAAAALCAAASGSSLFAMAGSPAQAPARVAPWSAPSLAALLNTPARPPGFDTSAAANAAAPQSSPNLLLITLDTLRADRVGAYGASDVETPALDRLATRGVRFAQATTTAPLTLPAHASILTGQNPYRHGVRDNHNFRLDDDALTLAEVLSAAGYETGGFIGSWVLHADTGVAQGFDEYTRFDDATVRDLTSAGFEAQRRGGLVAADAVPWIISRGGKFFAWVHLFDPHLAYDPPAPYDARYAGRPYDGEVAYADEIVGELLRALATAGRATDTIVAVVADHGEGLGDHGEQRHSFFIYDEVTHVPMMLMAPGRLPAGAVVDAQVSVVDLMPTLLGLMGVDDPRAGTRDGVDLAPVIRGEASGHPAYSESIVPRVEFGWSELRSLRADGFKYIAAPRPELYDLGADTGESDNLLAAGAGNRSAANAGGGSRAAANTGGGDDLPAAQAARAAAMREVLATMTAGDDLDSLALGERFISRPQVEQLRALGYIGGGGPAAGNDDDPKDHVELFEAFQDGVRGASRALQLGNWEAAGRFVDLLEELLPEHHLAHYYRGRLLLLRGEPEAAIEPLEESRRLGPAHTLAYTDLAAAYRLAGRTQEAREVLQQAMTAFPDLIVFPLLLGSHYHEDGLLDEALDAYLTAEAIDPRSPTLLRNLGQLYLVRGEFAESVATFARLVEVAPDDGAAWVGYGLALEGAADLTGADTAFGRALELTPDDAAALFHRARVAVKTGRNQIAISLLRRALEIDPDYAEAREALERLLRAP